MGVGRRREGREEMEGGRKREREEGCTDTSVCMLELEVNQAMHLAPWLFETGSLIGPVRPVSPRYWSASSSSADLKSTGPTPGFFSGGPVLV